MSRAFKKTLEFLEKIPFIDNGGCGMAALALYDAAKREKKQAKIVYVYHPNDDTSYIRNLKFKQGKVKRAEACMHIVVKVGRTHYDAAGKVPRAYLQNYLHDSEITREHLIASINNIKDWNPLFSRRVWGPSIAKFFKRGTQINF